MSCKIIHTFILVASAGLQEKTYCIVELHFDIVFKLKSLGHCEQILSSVLK